MECQNFIFMAEHWKAWPITVPSLLVQDFRLLMERKPNRLKLTSLLHLSCPFFLCLLTKASYSCPTACSSHCHIYNIWLYCFYSILVLNNLWFCLLVRTHSKLKDLQLHLPFYFSSHRSVFIPYLPVAF